MLIIEVRGVGSVPHCFLVEFFNQGTIPIVHIVLGCQPMLFTLYWPVSRAISIYNDIVQLVVFCRKAHNDQ